MKVIMDTAADRHLSAVRAILSYLFDNPDGAGLIDIDNDIFHGISDWELLPDILFALELKGQISSRVDDGIHRVYYIKDE
jgi:hypothetical protein